MKQLFLVLYSAGYIFAASFDQLDIDLKASFYIQKQNRQSHIKQFEYQFSIFHNLENRFTRSSYCVYGKESMKFSNKVDKQKYMMCLNEDGTEHIYSLSKSFRYIAQTEYNIKIESVDVLITSKTSSKTCQFSVKNYNALHKAINNCIMNEL